MVQYADTATVKKRMEIDPDNFGLDQTEFDELLNKLNSQVSELINSVTQRDFERHPSSGYESKELNGEGYDTLRVGNYPIIEIDSITVSNYTLESSEYYIKGKNDMSQGNPGIVVRESGIWPEGSRNIEISFAWGYESPPDDVVMVAEDLMVEVLSEAMRDIDHGRIESFSMDGVSTTFLKREYLTSDRKAVLSKYSNRSFV